jgi:hypothetical protein
MSEVISRPALRHQASLTTMATGRGFATLKKLRNQTPSDNV